MDCESTKVPAVVENASVTITRTSRNQFKIEYDPPWIMAPHLDEIEFKKGDTLTLMLPEIVVDCNAEELSDLIERKKKTVRITTTIGELRTI